MTLEYARPERIGLKGHPEFDESWLQDKIAEDPTILGLGELIVLDRERRQERAGRLDLLLTDPDGDIRYEVELMLGATDASHIVRTLEYWDIERRRYPAYEHVAVLVAEDVTSRFLNVLSLLSGTVPLVAIQLSALRVGGHVVLHAAHVLDQRQLREDEETELGDGDRLGYDRAWWVQKKGAAFLAMIDRVFALLNQVAGEGFQPNYNRGYVSVLAGRRRTMFVFVQKRSQKMRLNIQLADADEWAAKFDERGVEADVGKRRRLRLHIDAEELEQHAGLIGEAMKQAVEEYRG